MTSEETHADALRWVAEFRTWPMDDQLAFASNVPWDMEDNLADHRRRLNSLSAREQKLYAQTRRSMLLWEPVKNEAAAAVVMQKMSRDPGRRCACSSCSPLLS